MNVDNNIISKIGSIKKESICKYIFNKNDRLKVENPRQSNDGGKMKKM